MDRRVVHSGVDEAFVRSWTCIFGAAISVEKFGGPRR